MNEKDFKDAGSIMDCDADIEQDNAGLLIAKTACVTLPTVLIFAALIAAIIVIVNPFLAMGAYDNLGMYDRALNCAVAYIDRTEKEQGVSESDYLYVSNLHEDKNFVSAERRAIAYSAKMFDFKSTKYATELERFTREFCSLYGATATNTAISNENISAVSPALRPTVYSYNDYLKTLNFKARIAQGDMSKMLYNGSFNVVGDRVENGILIETQTVSNTHASLTEESISEASMDSFSLYLSQLNAYLEYEFTRSGMYSLPDLSDSSIADFNFAVGQDYFGFFVDKMSGYTYAYRNLSNFRQYLNYALSYNYANENDELRRLYWLNNLTRFTSNMSAMSRALWKMCNADYFHESVLGDLTNPSLYTIRKECYNTFGNQAGRWEDYSFATYNGDKVIISQIYILELNNYVGRFDA